MAKRDFVESSGNIFADLGSADAEEKLAKAELAIKIAEILRRRRLTQVQAAAVLGLDQPKVSALLRGRISGFSIERLLRLLLRLGVDVSITINHRSQPRARTAKRGGKIPAEGILTVDEIVAERESMSRGRRQRAA